jgi:mRNA interferase RelE/StbE
VARPIKTYTIEIAQSAARDLAKIRSKDAASAARISKAIDNLSSNPRPPGTKALQGEAGVLRIRVGDCRVLYAIEDAALVVLVVAIGHRRQVYR